MHAVKYEAAHAAAKKRALTNSKECEIMFREIWDTPTINKYESVYAIYINSKKEVIDSGVINIGMRSSCNFNIRTILEGVFANNAFGVVIAHNHPSANELPSNDDIQITQSLKELCCKLEICLLDHIIITDDKYYSIKDNNDLK